MIKILHISEWYGWGGGEQQFFDLMEGLNEMGNSDNLLLCFKDSPIHNYAVKTNINVIAIKKQKHTSIKHLKTLKKIVNEYNPKIIHIHSTRSLLGVIFANIFFNFNAAIVYTVNNIKKKKKNFLSRLKHNYYNIILVHAISESVGEAYKKTVLFNRNRNKVRLVFDGIKITQEKATSKLSSIYNFSQNKLIVGNISNHVDAKDLTVFVEMINYIVNTKKIKKFHFVQIGNKTKLSDNLLKLVNDYNLEKHITFTGFLNNASSFIHQFNYFVLTSKREGLSISILESFLNKVAVISTNAGGIPEAVAHNVNGLLSDVGNSTELAKNLIFLSEETEIKNSFVKKSYEKLLLNFTHTTAANKMFELYNEAIKIKSPKK